MYKFKKIFRNELNVIKNNGLYKEERALKTPQGVEVKHKITKLLTTCALIIIWG